MNPSGVTRDGHTLTLPLGTGDPISPANPPRQYYSRVEERVALIFPDFALQLRSSPARR